MREGFSLLLMLALLFPVVASCTATGASPTPGSPQETPSGSSKGSNLPADVPSGAEEPVRLAVQDLSRLTGVPEDQIQVQRIEELEWPDASLGCPAPGKMYAQIITSGYRILLTAQGKTYEYHSDRARTVVLCEKPA